MLIRPREAIAEHDEHRTLTLLLLQLGCAIAEHARPQPQSFGRRHIVGRRHSARRLQHRFRRFNGAAKSGRLLDHRHGGHDGDGRHRRHVVVVRGCASLVAQVAAEVGGRRMVMGQGASAGGAGFDLFAEASAVELQFVVLGGQQCGEAVTRLQVWVIGDGEQKVLGARPMFEGYWWRRRRRR